MSEHAEQVYREYYPMYAKVGDILIPHGWERVQANTWNKKDGRRRANVVCRGNGEIHAKGYLPLLAEAYRLLKEGGIIHD